MKEFEYIDLGLKSSLKWSNCYISRKFNFSYILHLPEEQYRCYHKFLPTLDDFIELRNSCKFKLYKKGNHEFYLITGPNENKLKLIKSVYYPAVGISIPYVYWIKDGFFVDDRNVPRAINIVDLINNSDINIVSQVPQWGYLVFIKK